MATLMVYMPEEDQAGEELRREFENRNGVESVMIVASRVGDTALASEASLAEAWLSPEGDHWDDYYKELCAGKAS